jgi:hypothetical protein
MLLWSPLFQGPLRIAAAIAAVLAIMIARTCDLPPAAGLPGAGAASQIALRFSRPFANTHMNM